MCFFVSSFKNMEEKNVVHHNQGYKTHATKLELQMVFMHVCYLTAPSVTEIIRSQSPWLCSISQTVLRILFFG